MRASFIPITILSTLALGRRRRVSFAASLSGRTSASSRSSAFVLLIGIVKKNGIMMVDFALEAERNHGKSSTDAIFEACLRCAFVPS